MAAVDAVLAASSARERLGLPSGEKLSAAGLAQARRGHSNVDSLCSVRKCFYLGCIKTQRASSTPNVASKSECILHSLKSVIHILYVV